MLSATTLSVLAGEGPAEAEGVSIILPSAAELFLPAIAFALLAAVAGFVIWRIVRAVSRDSDDLASQVARLEAENHELRVRLEEHRSQHV